MIALEEFLEPIELAGTPLNYQAYRMDGNTPSPDMRKDVGLGTCNCCDYFVLSKEGAVVLIEETELMAQIKGLKDEYNYLRGTNQTEFVTKYIRQENRLKAYGSMLVLCRLAAVCKDAKDMLQTKKYKFWIVVSGMYSTEDARFFRNLKNPLLNELKSVLTGEIVDSVEILPFHVLENKLSEYATTC